MKRTFVFLATAAFLHTSAALAQFDSGSDGSDGAFNPSSLTTVDLALATTASWDTPSPIPGQGVYDSDLWVVVFKYTTIDIPGNAHVLFSNHPSGAPVVWLATGDVTINANIVIEGSEPGPFATPGPGGFAGGQQGLNCQNMRGAGGFGPGGGDMSCTSGGDAGHSTDGGGSLGGLAYGNPSLIPLMGGSGGGALGGGGGGAILIATPGHIQLDGDIFARGGGGQHDGSGGSIRLRSSSISGSGGLIATATLQASDGRIRIEASTNELGNLGDPPWTWITIPNSVFPPPNAPTLRATFVDGQSVPTDPDAGIETTEVQLATEDPVTVEIEAMNIPEGTTVDVRVVPARGDSFTVTSTPLIDIGGGLLMATAQATLPRGRTEIQLRANWTP